MIEIRQQPRDGSNRIARLRTIWTVEPCTAVTRPRHQQSDVMATKRRGEPSNRFDVRRVMRTNRRHAGSSGLSNRWRTASRAAGSPGGAVSVMPARASPAPRRNQMWRCLEAKRMGVAKFQVSTRRPRPPRCRLNTPLGGRLRYRPARDRHGRTASTVFETHFPLYNAVPSRLGGRSYSSRCS